MGVWLAVAAGQSARAGFVPLFPATGVLQVNELIDSYQSNPDVAIAGSRFFVVFGSSHEGGDPDGGVRMRTFGTDGEVLGGEVFVNAETAGLQSRPRVAADPDGNVTVVWQADHSDAFPDPSLLAIRAQRFDPFGVPDGGELEVNQFGQNNQDQPDAASNFDGRVFVVWRSFGAGLFPGEPGDDTGYGIHGRLLAEGGGPLTDEFELNEVLSGTQAAPAVASDGSGWIVVWESDSSAGGDVDGTSIQGRCFRADGTPSGQQFQVNTTTVGAQLKPAVAAGPSGFVVVWESLSAAATIRGRRFGNGCDPLADDFRVDGGEGVYPGNPDVGVDAGGNFAAVWEDQLMSDWSFVVHGQAFGADGAPLGPRVTVNENPFYRATVPALAMTLSGDAVVAWESDGSDHPVLDERDDDFTSVQTRAYGPLVQDTLDDVPDPENGRIAGYLWVDENRDGVHQWTENPVDGVRVTLYEPGDVFVDQTHTHSLLPGAPGYYAFTDVPTGTYFLEFDAAPALTLTFDNVGPDDDLDSDPDPGTGRTVPFNYTSPMIDDSWSAGVLSGIGDRVWRDLDGDGLQDAGEPGIAGIDVRLVQAHTGIVAGTTVTLRSGYYTFVDAPAAEYRVEFVAPEGARFTVADAGGDEQMDSDVVDPSSGRTHSFYYPGVGEVPDLDAGLVPMGDLIFQDSFESGTTAAWLASPP